jgi:RecB family exonuclease
MGAHSRFAASSASRWIYCPASVRLSDAVPATDAHPAAARGSAIHHIAYELWCGQDFPSAGDWWCRAQGKEYFSDILPAVVEESCQVDQEMIDEATLYSKFCQALADKYRGARTYCEARINLTAQIGGTVDFAVVREDRIVVIDLKTGAEPVSPEENTQLMLYAAMLIGDHDGSTPVVLGVFQRGTPAAWTTTAAHVLDVAGQAIFASQRVDSPPRAGEHCTYCPAGGVCSARAAMEIATTPAMSPTDPPAPETLTPEMIAQVLDAEKRITEWIKKVKAHVMHTRPAIPGWKFVAGVSRREIARPEIITQYAAETGIDVMRSEFRTLAELDKLIPPDVMTAACDKPPAPLALVRDTDKRPAIVASTVDALDALE